MLLTIGILLILGVALYSGAKRGLILQLILTIGYLLSFWFALRYYQQLRGPLEMVVPYPHASLSDSFVLFSREAGLQLDNVFYNGVSFVLILSLGWFATRLVGGLLEFVSQLPLLKQVNMAGGAVLNFVVNYIGLFLVLFILSTVPMPLIQKQIERSSIAQIIVTRTPKLSTELYEQWQHAPR